VGHELRQRHQRHRGGGARLRAKVDDAFEPKLIRTVRGMGYVL
jgi:hypothetical protein